MFSAFCRNHCKVSRTVLLEYVAAHSLCNGLSLLCKKRFCRTNYRAWTMHIASCVPQVLAEKCQRCGIGINNVGTELIDTLSVRLKHVAIEQGCRCPYATHYLM